MIFDDHPESRSRAEDSKGADPKNGAEGGARFPDGAAVVKQVLADFSHHAGICSQAIMKAFAAGGWD